MMDVEGPNGLVDGCNGYTHASIIIGDEKSVSMSMSMSTR